MMMHQKAVLSMVLISCSILLQGIQPSYTFHINSYLGSYYHPGRTENEYQYLEDHDLRSGCKLSLSSHVKIWLESKAQQNQLERKLLLHKMGIAVQKKGIELSFKKDRIKIGNGSLILNENVYNSYFDTGVIADYDYTGFMVKAEKPDISFLMGGNDFNTSLVLLSGALHNEAGYFRLNYFEPEGITH